MQVTAGIGAHAQTWLVDTLHPEVRTSMHLCNDFFADPSIVKVMHGANMDIQVSSFFLLHCDSLPLVELICERI